MFERNQDSRIVFIYGRTGSGKSDLLEEILEKVLSHENEKILIFDTKRVHLFGYSTKENVTFAYDNYLENLSLFRGKYIFIDEIFGSEEKGFKKKLIEKIEKEKMMAFITSQTKCFSTNDYRNIILVNLGNKY